MLRSDEVITQVSESQFLFQVTEIQERSNKIQAAVSLQPDADKENEAVNQLLDKVNKVNSSSSSTKWTNNVKVKTENFSLVLDFLGIICRALLNKNYNNTCIYRAEVNRVLKMIMHFIESEVLTIAGANCVVNRWVLRAQRVPNRRSSNPGCAGASGSFGKRLCQELLFLWAQFARCYIGRGFLLTVEFLAGVCWPSFCQSLPRVEHQFVGCQWILNRTSGADRGDQGTYTLEFFWHISEYWD